MWRQVATAIGIKTVEKLFERFSVKDAGSISVGLAVGYYYNFLETISNVIERNELELYSSPTDSSPKKFKSEDVRVQVIIPSRLNVEAFKRCEEEFKTTHKGFIYLSRNKRFYGVNYTLTELPTRSELTIVDLARPIMVTNRYYEDILKQDTYDETDKEWIKIQIAEITAFKETIRRLQKRGYGALLKKLDFRERA